MRKMTPIMDGVEGDAGSATACHANWQAEDIVVLEFSS